MHRFIPTALLLLPLFAAPAFALDGQIATHDPSSVIVCDGKFYCYATGNLTPMVSSDGWTWQRGSVSTLAGFGGRIPESVRALSPANNGTQVWAPDVVKIGDTYFLYYAVSAWMDYRSVVGLMTSPSLDPQSPNYKWTDCGPIVSSDGNDGQNAIDPGVMYDPSTKSLWMVYGSYHGTIQLVELDPQTGLRKDKSVPTTTVASQSEAADLMVHDGWYYLLTNHGSCCNGATSTYNLRVGRSKKVTGPYLDSYGIDMAKGGGNLFLAAGDGHIGPGHFGCLQLDGVEKFSCHYEADTSHGGSILDIRPLLWRDGWPLAGSDPKEGVYQVMSKRTGTVIELAVPGVPAVAARGRAGGGGGGGGGRGRGGAASQPATAASQPPASQPLVAAQTIPAASQPIPNPVDVRLAASLIQFQQRWTIAPAAGGFYRLTNALGSALQLTDAGILNAAPAATPAADAQLWKLDELPDGSFRIQPKTKNLALTAGERNALLLRDFNPADDNQKWLLENP